MQGPTSPMLACIVLDITRFLDRRARSSEILRLLHSSRHLVPIPGRSIPSAVIYHLRPSVELDLGGSDEVHSVDG